MKFFSPFYVTNLFMINIFWSSSWKNLFLYKNKTSSRILLERIYFYIKTKDLMKAIVKNFQANLRLVEEPYIHYSIRYQRKSILAFDRINRCRSGFCAEIWISRRRIRFSSGLNSTNPCGSGLTSITTFLKYLLIENTKQIS